MPPKSSCVWLLEHVSGKFLIVRRQNKTDIPYPGYWCLPGGAVEEGETPEKATERELREEFGYSSPRPTKILTLYYPQGAAEHYFHILLSADLQDLACNEAEEMKLVTMHELENTALGWWQSDLVPLFRRFTSEVERRQLAE